MPRKHKGAAAAAARALQTILEGNTHPNLALAKLISDDSAKIDEAQKVFDAFDPKAPADIEIYAKCAKKFKFSINSKKVKSCLPEIFNCSLHEFGDYIKAFCECGFYQEHLALHAKAIRAKTFALINEEFSKRKPSANAIIALLIHVKNLGILDENFEAQHFQDLRKALILLPSFNLTDTAYSSLLEVSLYCKEVLKMGLPQKLIEYNKSRKVAAVSDSTSKIHLKFVEKLAKYLSRKSFNGEKRDIKKDKDGNYHCGNLRILVEAKYGKLSQDGKLSQETDEIKTGDVLLILKRADGSEKYLEIEVDGDKSHAVTIDGALSVNGQTRSRDRVLREVFFGKVLVVKEKDFDRFQRQENADDFFEEVQEINSIIRELEEDFRPKADEDRATAAMTEFDINEKPKAEVPATPRKPDFKEEAEVEASAEKASELKLPQQSDQEILDYYAQIRREEEKKFKGSPEQYLMAFIDKEKLDLEEFEQLLLDYKASTDFERTVQLMKSLLTKVIQEKGENIELFLLLLVNCSRNEWNEMKEKIESQVKDNQVFGELVKRVNYKFSQRGSKPEQHFDSFIFSSSFTENREKLRKLILNIQDGTYVFSSRWELEYMFLDGSSSLENFLHAASNANNTEAVRFLLEKEKLSEKLKVLLAKFSEKEQDDLLYNCFFYQNAEMLRLLVGSGLKLRVNYDNDSYFGRAHRLHDTEMLRCFVEELHYDVNHKIKSSNIYYFPVHLASKEGNLKALQYLISRGADLSKTDSSGDSALYYAAYYDDSEIYTFLREQCKLKFIPDDASIDQRRNFFFNKLPVIFKKNIRHGIRMAQDLIEEEQCEAKWFLQMINSEYKGDKVKRTFLIYLMSSAEIPLEFVSYILEQNNFVEAFKKNEEFYMKQLIDDCFNVFVNDVEVGRLDVIKLICERLYPDETNLAVAASAHPSPGFMKIFEYNDVICYAVEKGQVDLLEYFIGLYKKYGLWNEEQKKDIRPSANLIDTSKDNGDAKRKILELLFEKEVPAVAVAPGEAVAALKQTGPAQQGN